MKLVKSKSRLVVAGVVLFIAGCFAGSSRSSMVYAQGSRGGIPKSYGHLVAAVANPQGTGLVFEDSEGTIRLVSITGKLESELTRH